MMLASHVVWTKSRILPESSAIAESSGGDAEAGAHLPDLLQLERRVRDPGELAAEAAVDERRLAADVGAVALGASSLRPGEESLGGPLQGVLGRETDDGRGGRGVRFHPLRPCRLHERRPLYSKPTRRSAEKGCAGAPPSGRPTRAPRAAPAWCGAAAAASRRRSDYRRGAASRPSRSASTSSAHWPRAARSIIPGRVFRSTACSLRGAPFGWTGSISAPIARGCCDWPRGRRTA